MEVTGGAFPGGEWHEFLGTEMDAEEQRHPAVLPVPRGSDRVRRLPRAGRLCAVPLLAARHRTKVVRPLTSPSTHRPLELPHTFLHRPHHDALLDAEEEIVRGLDRNRTSLSIRSLTKAVLDGLEGQLFSDDARIVELVVRKRYGEHEGGGGGGADRRERAGGRRGGDRVRRRGRQPDPTLRERAAAVAVTRRREMLRTC